MNEACFEVPTPSSLPKKVRGGVVGEGNEPFRLVLNPTTPKPPNPKTQKTLKT